MHEAIGHEFKANIVSYASLLGYKARMKIWIKLNKIEATMKRKKGGHQGQEGIKPSPVLKHLSLISRYPLIPVTIPRWTKNQCWF